MIHQELCKCRVASTKHFNDFQFTVPATTSSCDFDDDNDGDCYDDDDDDDDDGVVCFRWVETTNHMILALLHTSKVLLLGMERLERAACSI